MAWVRDLNRAHRFRKDVLRILVVFCSRSGRTRRIAKALSKELECDLEEINEPRTRTGLLGYIRSLLEAPEAPIPNPAEEA
jgi:hypothetical protein